VSEARVSVASKQYVVLYASYVNDSDSLLPSERTVQRVLLALLLHATTVSTTTLNTATVSATRNQYRFCKCHLGWHCRCIHCYCEYCYTATTTITAMATASTAATITASCNKS
jgi:hypothetical protein